jgi:hypothetical protein
VIVRTVSSATTATTWPPVNVHCEPPAQLTVRMMNAPTGRAIMARPLPDPCPGLGVLSAAYSRGALDLGRGNDGHAVLLVRLAEHPLDRQRISRLGDDV